MNKILLWIAVWPASILTALIVYFALSFVFGLASMFAPKADYGEPIALVSLGLAAHSYIVTAAYLSPSYKKQIALILMIITSLVLLIVGVKIIVDKLAFTYEIAQILSCLTFMIIACLRIKKAEKIDLNTFLIG